MLRSENTTFFPSSKNFEYLIFNKNEIEVIQLEHLAIMKLNILFIHINNILYKCI